MDRSKLATFFTWLAVFALYGWWLPLLLKGSISTQFADSLVYLPGYTAGGAHLVVNQFSYAFFSWKLDPVLDWLLLQLPDHRFFIAVSAIFAGGCFLLFHELFPGKSVLYRLALSLAIIPFLGLSIGFDTTVASFLIWVPWYTRSVARVTAKHGPLWLETPLLFAFAVLMAISSNQYSWLALCAALLLARGEKPSSPSLSGLTVVFLSAIPALLTPFFLPLPRMPLYPQHARVILGRALLSGRDALIGVTPPLQLVDRLWLREAIVPAGLLLMALVLFSFALVAAHRHRQSSVGTWWVVFVVLSLSIALDSSLFPEGMNLIGPIYSVERSVPLGVLLPLAPIAIATAMLFFVSVLGAASALGSSIVLSLAALVLSLTPSPTLPFLSRSGHYDLATLLQDRGALDPRMLRKIISPSLEIVSQLGADGLSEMARAQEEPFRPLSAFPHTLHASHNEKDLAVLSNGEPNTRWGTGKGDQTGEEWVMVYFPDPAEIEGISLSSPNYPTDFPRGIELRAGLNCTESDKNFDHYRRVFFQPHWQGSVKLTKDGFPYYTHESSVVIQLRAPVEAHCFVIKQIGQEAGYDWSISQIMLQAKVREVVPPPVTEAQPAENGTDTEVSPGIWSKSRVMEGNDSSPGS